MKKSLIILSAILFATISAATAQVAGGRVAIENISVERQGESVEVNYVATIAPGAVKRDHTLMFAPVIVGEGFRQSLPAVVVHGPGSKVARRRRELSFGTNPGYGSATVATNGGRGPLSATVPFQEWMSGAEILFEAIEGGCCSSTILGSVAVARDILPQPAAHVAIPEPEPEWVPVSVGDSLSTAFTFVVPFSEFDPEDPFKIYDDERGNALEVYFRLAKYDMDPLYPDNSYNLGNLVGCINMIMASGDSRVERIIVGGFASPEGSTALNDRLAFERAVTLKRYIMDNTAIRDDQVAVFNGSVDWRGLRMRIARSNMEEKDELLALIDNTPVEPTIVSPGRLEALRRLRGGSTYFRLQLEHFPYLRTGAFIKVFYRNR